MSKYEYEFLFFLQECSCRNEEIENSNYFRVMHKYQQGEENLDNFYYLVIHKTPLNFSSVGSYNLILFNLKCNEES